MCSDYFVNHKRASKFPWSIYHRPLEKDLERFLAGVSGASPHPKVLVLGGGFLHELPWLPRNLRLTAVDIDDRVTRFLSALGDERLVRCITIANATDLQALGPFDAIYAKEVIEHIVEIEAYLRVLVGILKPGGRLWLSTPNYGDPWLPLLESTVLELIGRFSGYSRRDLHPTRFSADRLAKLLEREELEAVHIEKTRFRLALACTARKPSAG